MTGACKHVYRRSPCDPSDTLPGCPWRKDQPAGGFPVERYRALAGTAKDMARTVFACHKSTEGTPLYCAGFILRGAEHNLTYRMDLSRGVIDPSRVHDGGHDLHPGYVSMAVENGVDPDDPALRGCRLSPWEEQEGGGWE